ncbi:MAG: right-handed parallel beta-helix repeat-containing protein [Phycisphaerales bacterium]|nr:right-handed parallel beta-helix repeat-containing protein [Phycisphaerales bacterium]
MPRSFSHRFIARVALGACIAPFITTALAGPLNPPAGPVAPTPGPEPRIAINDANTLGDNNSLYRITQSGSYYLTGNINGVAAKSGIEIAASRVTIDLNGFAVIGVPGSLDGIVNDISSRNSIIIRNGTVAAWGQDGINLFNSTTGSCILEDLSATNNAGNGIRANGAIVRNCHVTLNTLDGITGVASAIGCVARDNGQQGIQVNAGGTISQCTAFENGTYGLYGSNGVNITDSSAYNNLGTGIILFGDGLIKNCSASNNGADGINGQQGTTIIDCIASDNGADGIVVLNDSLVRGNTCHSNTSDGIFVSSTNNCRIEGNIMHKNGRGLHVIGSGSVIVRNSASGNTSVNWLIAANNVVGPILNRTAPASAAINGDSAPSSLGSTDANANYTH